MAIKMMKEEASMNLLVKQLDGLIVALTVVKKSVHDGRT